jgi:hypothetical protein
MKNDADHPEGSLVEVYRAKDGVQAHFMKNALEDAGIAAWVVGDLLQGAIAGFPMGWSSLPRILVSEANAAKAAKILRTLEPPRSAR